MSASCINLGISRIGKPILVDATRIGGSILIDATRIGGPISVDATRIGGPILIETERIGKPINIRCGLVCSVSEAAYLRVEPNAIWLLPDSAEVVVYSNVTWYIE